MLTEHHISEIRAAGRQLREDAKTLDVNSNLREVLANRLDSVIEKASRWKPPGDPTPINKVSWGSWFLVSPGGSVHYVDVRRRTSDDQWCIYGPEESIHGRCLEDVLRDSQFYAAPSDEKLAAMCAEEAEVTP